MKRFSKIMLSLAGLLLLLILAVRWWVPPYVERDHNGVRQPPPYAPSEAALALHRRLFIADLHAESNTASPAIYLSLVWFNFEFADIIFKLDYFSLLTD